jgi:tripartite-type tricarboxylate transporter receptor subunit TctC
VRDQSLELFRSAVIASTLLAASLAPAHAGPFPTRPIQVIVSYPAGGAYDTATRIIAPKMSEILGQPLVIIPKPGASGSLAVGFVLKSPPDGYTLSSTATASLTLNPVYMKELTYTYKDAAPIGTFAVEVNAIVVRTDSKWKTFAALLDDATKNPGKLTYGSPGPKSVSTTVMEVIKAERGLNVVSVPFVGSPPVAVALLGKQVDFGTLALSVAAPMIKAGQLRLLAVGGTQRSPMFPDVKTFKELGFKTADLQLKIGLFASAKTPRATMKILSDAFAKAAADPQVSTQLAKVGLLPLVEDSKAAETALRQEMQDVNKISEILKITK